MEQGLPAIGNLESKCPYCSHPLEHLPERKTRCPCCGNAIHVRTRPADRKCVLLTEDQAELVKEQWAIVDGVHAEYLFHRKRIRDARADLTVRLGGEPSAEQIRLELLIEDAKIHARNHQWGLFASVRQQMADIRRRTSRPVEALAEHLEVCYLQLNGPNNLATFMDRGRRTPILDPRFPSWDPKGGELLPLTLERTASLVEEACLGRETVRAMFIEAATRLRLSLELPLSSKRAWRRLSRQLFRRPR